jgi:hypothetical protein
LVLPVREIQLVEKMDNTTGNELGNNALLITTKGKVPVSLPVLEVIFDTKYTFVMDRQDVNNMSSPRQEET